MANTTTTFDARPTFFGDRMIVTGSYSAGDGAGAVTISVSDLLASIDAVIVNPNSLQNQGIEDGAAADESDAVIMKTIDLATFSDTTITITPGQAGGTVVAGTFLVIGRRS
tara:strand:- start:2729 stop:3061 length:333 start_codon:yes stop_codon:yes gene_type:complete